MLVINNAQPPTLLRNRLELQPKRHWLAVALRGTTSNALGIGARVTVTAGGKTQVRELHCGSGFLSSPAPEAHFGLGKTSTVDRLEVRWPSGKRTVLERVAVDRVLTIRED